MRRIMLLAVPLLSILASVPAHADTIYTYTGTVLLNGFWTTYTGDQPATEHDYVNLPVSATVLIDPLSPVIYGVSIDFPDNQFDSDNNPEEYVNFDNCTGYGQNCNDVYLSYVENPLAPSPSLTLDGERNYSSFDPDTQTYLGWSEDFSGNLNLVTAATPEPSTFSLLGTGVLGLAGILKRRRAALSPS